MRTLLWLCCLFAVTLSAQFHPVGATVTAHRAGDPLVPLRDGRVLVLGGGYAAEIFDPATSTFRPTQDMVYSADAVAAIPLRDGRIFVAGHRGYYDAAEPTQAQLFDPVKETFSAAGTVPGRYPVAPQLALLADGSVLINSLSIDVAVYDVRTGAFTPLSVDDTRFLFGQTAGLPDGRIAAAGYNSLVIYDRKDGVLKVAREFPFGSSWGNRSIVPLANGNLLIAGGARSVDGPNTDEAYVYNPHREQLIHVGLLITRQDRFTSTLLADGRVLITGGFGMDEYGYGLTPGEEVYDPATYRVTWIRGPQSKTDGGNLSGLGAARLSDGRVLFVGPDPFGMTYTPPPRIVSAASNLESLAPDSLATFFGARLSLTTEAAQSTPFPFVLGDIRVDVTDKNEVERPARLLYVSPTQINFLIPEDAGTGALRVTVRRADGMEASALTFADRVAPALFTLEHDIAAANVVRQEQDGKTTLLNVREPIALDARPVFLVLYGTGIRGRRNLSDVTCRIGGVDAPVYYAGPDGSGIEGIDQVNIRIPESVQGRGSVDVALAVEGKAANIVNIDVR